jgi:hypothetical protein
VFVHRRTVLTVAIPRESTAAAEYSDSHRLRY